MVLALSQLGALCEPSPTPQCPGCPAGQVSACTDRCVTPVAINAPCSTDPCAPNGTCVEGATCVSTSSTSAAGVCMNLHMGLGALCYGVGSSGMCSNELYCHEAGCPFVTNSICALPVGDGHPCDSDSTAPKCSPCQPGETCVKGYCHQPCTTTSDCLCGQGYTCTPAGDTDVTANLCYACKSFGDTGCDSEHPCCDSSICAGDRCCKPHGQSCTTKADCCGATDLCKGGSCQACGVQGANCSTAGECCSGICNKDGKCANACTNGALCTVPGKKGPCASGATQCDGLGNATCVQTVFPTAEACDGKDNDCDGTVDDAIPSAPCPSGKLPVTCQAGFSVPGTTSCVNGKEQCVARACAQSSPNDTDCYCTSNAGSSGGMGKPCGEAGQTPCIPGVTYCIPSAVCAGSPGNELCKFDNVCAVQPDCWTPADVKLPPNHCYGQ